MNILYLVYWGAAEPLGQSLVVPAVLRLAKMGVKISLVTFEKGADLDRPDQMDAIRRNLNDCGVDWRPLRYHRHPKVLAKALDFLQGWLTGLTTDRIDIVHARTYVGGLIGLPLARALGAPAIYHNEGFYPDEQVDAGVWRNGSWFHRFARGLERRMYAGADGIIALSNRARQIIQKMPEVRRRRTTTITVPSCVDLERFSAPVPANARKTDVMCMVYLGSIGLRYLFDRVARFVAVATGELGNVRLRVLTPSPREHVTTQLSASGVPPGAWSVDSVPHSAVPEELARQDVGLHFLPNGISEHGGSPTKFGEYWACGLPVVTTPNISDTDEIIQRERVGVVVREHSDEEYRRAARELRDLLHDPDLSARCRRAAETHYALEPACHRQVALYREVLNRKKKAVTWRFD